MVRALTQCTKDGRVYTRSRAVEAQIAEALALPPSELQGRVIVTDRSDPRYLKEETLVHLLREYDRRDDAAMCNALAEALARRCEPQAIKYLQSLGEDDFKDAHDELITCLFEKILDQTGDSGDFFEVAFGMGLRRLAISTFRHYTARINEDTTTLVPLSSLAGHDDDGDQHRSVPLTKAHLPTTSHHQWVLANEALAQIPEPQRTAFILLHWGGWPIESKDPHTPSISKYFKKTPRTIQNWLHMAEQALESWRGEEP